MLAHKYHEPCPWFSERHYWSASLVPERQGLVFSPIRLSYSCWSRSKVGAPYLWDTDRRVYHLASLPMSVFHFDLSISSRSLQPLTRRWHPNDGLYDPYHSTGVLMAMDIFDWITKSSTVQRHDYYRQRIAVLRTKRETWSFPQPMCWRHGQHRIILTLPPVGILSLSWPSSFPP